MTKPREILEDWIQALQCPRRKLTPWEEDFLASVSDQLAERGELTDRQEEILERIYAQKT